MRPGAYCLWVEPTKSHPELASNLTQSTRNPPYRGSVSGNLEPRPPRLIPTSNVDFSYYKYINGVKLQRIK